jgi:hypothetical protein
MLRTTLLAFAGLLAAHPSLADVRAAVPAGGGLPALDVKVDLASAMVDANGARLPIALDRAQLPAEAQVVVEAVPIGKGRQVAHVKVPAKDIEGLAWEAILAAGKREPLFAGLTGFVTGDPGERTGKAVQIVPGDAASFVLVGDVREDVGLCGQPLTLLDPQGLYPASLDLRPVTAQRLSPARQQEALPVAATRKGATLDTPLARLLVARGSSVSGSSGGELTDGDPTTVWSEQRPGIGQGEFVVMAAPEAVPISRLQIVPVPPGPGGDVAAPRTLYLVSSTQTFAITLPDDAWRSPGEAYEVVLPQPIESSCIALVLSDAYARGLPHPQVGVAELVAYSELDAPGVTLKDVAKKLSSARASVAAQVLERAGAPALAAVEEAYGDLDARGRAFAIDVAASHEGCVEAAPLLARGLCESAGEAPRKAREKLERCKGAAGVIAARMVQDAPSRRCLAPMLVTLAGPDALEPLADAMALTGEGERDVRATLRTAFADALGAAPRERLVALLGDTRRSALARLEMMRAAGPRVMEAVDPSDATMAEAFAGAPTMRTRYVALGPLGELARGGDASAATRIAEAMQHDTDWPVRARAAELGVGVASAQAALVTACRDPEPRVREAALLALSASSPPPPAGIEAAQVALRADGWPFVRAQALGVLARAPATTDVSKALRGALGDASSRVRGATLVAVALRRMVALRGPVRERLDHDDDFEVRAAAARALGSLCDMSSADRLTQLARGLGAPGTPEEEQPLALAALVGLAALQPPDLRDRLGPLLSDRAPASVRKAAQRALEARSVCH